MNRHQHYTELFSSAEHISVDTVALAVHQVRRERELGSAKELLVSTMAGQGVPSEWRAPITLLRALRKVYGEHISRQDALALLDDELWSAEGSKVRAWRERTGLTGDEAAALLDVSRRSVVKIESGKTPNPGAATMRRLERFLMRDAEEE